MKKIYALTTLNFNDGTSIKAFTPGFHDVRSNVMDHWSMKTHYSSDGEVPTLGNDSHTVGLEALMVEQATRIAEFEEQPAEAKTSGKKQRPADA